MQAEILKFKNRERLIFEPDIYKWIIITIRDYARRRRVKGYKEYIDLPEVDIDARNVKERIKGLGARDEDIIEITGNTGNDCDFERLSHLFVELNEEAIANWRNNNKKTFIFVYYAGHGTVMDGTTQIVLNINEGKKTPFPLETHLRILGTRKGVYVMGVLDCCRSPITAK